MIGIEDKTTPLIDYFGSLGYQAALEAGSSGKIKCYSSVDDEVRILHQGVGVRNISHEGIIELSGKDVIDFLHRITTNSLKDIVKGNVKDTIFTTEKGRIIDVVSVLNFEDHQMLLCSEANTSKVTGWLEKYVIADDVNVSNSTGKFAVLQVTGLQADSFMTLIAGKIVNEIAPDTFKVVRTEGIIFFLLKRVDQNGYNQFIIIADPANGLELVKYMNNNKGPFDFGMIGEDAYNLYRIEQGIPAAPGELNDSYNPHEVGLKHLINFTKGCYIGQEVIARLDSYDKVQRLLKQIVVEDPIEINGEYNLFDKLEREAGKITSLVYSNKLGKHVGLAYIRKAYSEDGTKLIAKNSHNDSAEIIVQNLRFKR